MLTTDLGACEWFVWDLRRSNLIDRGQLDALIGEFLGKNPGAEPPLLAEFLVSKNYLTEFQADRLLQGKTQGFVLGPFTLMDALGAGSMGTVYKATSKSDSKNYAVKVLPRRSMWNVRIARRKVRLFEQCQHPAVVPFIDVGTAGGMHYLAWPLVEGRTLEKIVEEKGHLSPEETAKFAIQTAEGLEAAHNANLFHGLLKPSNLMLGPDGQLRILDFGIGCLLAETEGESLVDTMSTANSVNSGLDCASPESIMDPTNLNAIGDQYSLGCVIYFCLTGRYPFPDGTAVEKMMCHQHKQPTAMKDINPDIPEEFVTVVTKLMEKNPASRYANCAEVLEVLRPLANANGAAAPILRRQTMQMPRVQLNRSAPIAQPQPQREQVEPPAVAPELSRPTQKPVQPLPARAPSAINQQREQAATNGAHPARQQPRPEPRQEPARPAPQRERVREPEPEEEEVMVEKTSPNTGGQKGFSLVTVILLAVVAGVAAFFASRFIPQ